VNLLNLDNKIFSYIYNFAGRSTPGDQAIIFLGKYFIYIVVAFIIFWFLYKHFRRLKTKRNMREIIAFLLAPLLAYFLLLFFREHLPRLRPFIELKIPHLLTEPTSSFPSGHTIFIFSIAGVAWHYSKKAFLLVFLAGLIIGLARIAGGVHYPSDILGGLTLGLFIGGLIGWLSK
jgi:undecaprenyl-diphosphatase